ncbi:MAG: 30S ribosomal protein S17 [Pirellulaceae bacterium]|nr:30S ribosomal protein S17 [Planctomycetales bacterium]
MPKRVLVGIVTSDKMSKTRVVEIARRERHPLYGKYVRKRTVCYVHDEQNEAHEGDRVEIIESRPRSAKKRWELVRIVEEGKRLSLAAVKANAAGQEGSES